MRKFLGILILISFFVTAFPRFSSAQYSQQQAVSQVSSEGEVLNALDDVKGFVATCQKFLEFARHPTGNVVKWIVGGENDEGLVGAIIYSISRIIGGDVSERPVGYLPSGAIAIPNSNLYLTGGILGTTKEYIASTISTPPASGVYYAADLIDRVGIKTAYANPTGLDFNGDQPVFKIWKQFRNLTFGLFAVAFVVMGLMIMFRVKISPQLVLTIEHALPKIILVLLLVSFSYAIAGFLVDLMYVFISMVVVFLNDLPGSGFFGIDPTPKSVIGLGIYSLLPPFTLAHLSAIELSGILGSLIGLVTFIVGGGIVGLVMFIALSILLWYWLFKLLIELTKSYLYIIFHIISAPFQIFMGVFPNSPIGFGSWFKNIFANILVFPAVIAVIMIGLSLSPTAVGGSSQIWTPPLLGMPTFNTQLLETVKNLGSAKIGFTIQALIAIVIFSFLPKVPGKIREMMGSIDFTAGLGERASALTATARMYGGGTGLRYIQSSFEEKKKTTSDAGKYDKYGKWENRTSRLIDALRGSKIIS